MIDHRPTIFRYLDWIMDNPGKTLALFVGLLVLLSILLFPVFYALISGVSK